MQLTLLDHGEAPLWCGLEGIQREWLDDASWVDVARGAVRGHAVLLALLQSSLAWVTADRRMYDRRVVVPRLMARGDIATLHPMVAAMQADLSRYYQRALREVTFALYRDGQDSVAWHRDRDLRDHPSAIVAIVSLGGARKFQLRPYDDRLGRGGGPSRSFEVGWGDLVVMGGACQRDWEHAVPKARHAEPRMAVMFRTRTPSVQPIVTG